jgi:hypothetical protein
VPAKLLPLAVMLTTTSAAGQSLPRCLAAA